MVGFIAVLILMFLGQTVVEGKTNTLDRKVLDYLYNATNDRNHCNTLWTGWGNSSSTSDPCTDKWYGITCVEEDSVQYVSEINLGAHELFSLPEEIIEMKHLKVLLLSQNEISTSNFQMGIFAMQTLGYQLHVTIPQHHTSFANGIT